VHDILLNNKMYLEVIFMQFYTYNVLWTEMSPFPWNGSITVDYLYLISRLTTA